MTSRTTKRKAANKAYLLRLVEGRKEHKNVPCFVMAEKSLIRLGVLTRPHGLAGGIRCRLDQQRVPSISTPCEVQLGYSLSFANPFELVLNESGREGEIVCFFRGIDDRDKAATIVDMGLFIDQNVLSYNDQFSDPGLIGFDVQDERENSLGQLSGIVNAVAHSLWRVKEGEREWLLPAIEEFILDIDTMNRLILVRLIPGLYNDDVEVVQ